MATKTPCPMGKDNKERLDPMNIGVAMSFQLHDFSIMMHSLSQIDPSSALMQLEIIQAHVNYLREKLEEALNET